jgi:hypothetical protein
MLSLTGYEMDRWWQVTSKLVVRVGKLMEFHAVVIPKGLQIYSGK